jgi:hypothetical protein
LNTPIDAPPQVTTFPNFRTLAGIIMEAFVRHNRDWLFSSLFGESPSNCRLFIPGTKKGQG